MTLVEHLEEHLGEMSGGWKDPHSRTSVQIAVFDDQPFEDINTYTTLGLSDYLLVSRTQTSSRQELVFTAYKNFDSRKVASFLSTFADSVILSKAPLLRGDVIGPSGPIILGSPLNSVYSAVPMIFPETFRVYTESTPETIFPWVIPIHEEEANYVRANGWSRFEYLLEEMNPELWDLRRSSSIAVSRNRKL